MAETKRMTAEQVVGYLLEGEGLDFLRESLAWVVQQLMEAEVSELIGAEHGERLAQEIEAFPLEQIADDLLSRHPLRLGHRGDSFRRTLGRADEFERRGGRTNYRLRPTLSYTTLRDVTLQ